LRGSSANETIPLCVAGSAKSICQHETQRLYGENFETDERSGLWHPAVTENVVRGAGAVFERLEPTVFLRASDALHLACAAENQFSEVYRGDQIFLQAAPHFG
jgi:hypothetical protein